MVWAQAGIEVRSGRSIAKVWREEIVDAAIDVFGRLGYRQGSVREVAATVGLTDYSDSRGL